MPGIADVIARIFYPASQTKPAVAAPSAPRGTLATALIPSLAAPPPMPAAPPLPPGYFADIGLPNPGVITFTTPAANIPLIPGVGTPAPEPVLGQSPTATPHQPIIVLTPDAPTTQVTSTISYGPVVPEPPDDNNDSGGGAGGDQHQQEESGFDWFD